MTIYKYPLQICGGHQRVLLPIGARILTAQMQAGALCLWAIVEPSDSSEYEETRAFQIFGTGQDLDGDETYIATVQQGPLVWHVFEVAA